MAKVIIPFIDNSVESSTVSITVDDAVSDANITSLFDAIVALTLGGDQVARLQTEVNKDGTASGASANKEAQREKKYVCGFSDDVTGDNYTREIPCADLASLVAGTDSVDLTATTGLALKTIWDSIVESKAGNATTLNYIRFAGRKL